MSNNYDFWQQYLHQIEEKLIKLCNKKTKISIDMHIHSNYSADGKQSIQEIISIAKKKKFDVIAITDHDTLDAYDEIYNMVKDNITYPIIVPGIEFTIDNFEYGSQCHMLQLFINPKDEDLINNVKTNYDASFNRSKIQLNRLKYNKAIQEIFNREGIKVSYNEYISFIKNNNMFPEYDTLCEYLMKKLSEKKITTFEVLTLLEKYNAEDLYQDRKEYKDKKYKKIRKKYLSEEKSDYSPRLLLSMLAVREVDDDWWDKPISGSLSVNSYGQLKIENLNKKFITFFAHPTENKLDVVEKIIESNKNIVGLEQNIRNQYLNINDFVDIINKYNLIRIIGSDSHDNSMQFYEDMAYFSIDSNEFKRILIGDNNGKN